jgi:NADPH:quinone reductase-like Zn-dependent oxidoreductase
MAVAHGLSLMRAAQITRFGGPEVMAVVDLPDPVPGEDEQLCDVSSSGVNVADTHDRPSANCLTPARTRGERTEPSPVSTAIAAGQ